MQNGNIALHLFSILIENTSLLQSYKRFAAFSLKIFPLLMNRVKIWLIPAKNTTVRMLAIASEVLLI